MTSDNYSAAPYEFLERFDEDHAVFHARDSRSGQACVIKFETPKERFRAENQNVLRERLAAEARRLQRWSQCPNVVRLLATELKRTPPFLVLEALGLDCEQGMPDDGLPLKECLSVLRDVSAALAGIHALNDWHGDIKPTNILRHPVSGCWTLIDPGGEKLETDEYSSPYVRGWHRDILALGRTFITLYTGALDEELPEDYHPVLEDEQDGDRLIRLLKRMVNVRRSPERGPNTRPTAHAVFKLANAMLRRMA